MTYAIFLGLIAGIDNFAVSAGFGAQGLDRRKLLLLVAGFAGFEALMPLAGYLLLGGMAVSEGMVGLLLLAAAVLVALPVIAPALVIGKLASSGWLLAFAPLLLSLDNLALGGGMAGLGGISLSAVALTGISAALVTVAGLHLGRTMQTRLRLNPQIALAATLVLAAVLDLSGAA